MKNLRGESKIVQNSGHFTLITGVTHIEHSQLLGSHHSVGQ